MDSSLAKQLTQHVAEFYETHGAAFSRTRHQYWELFETIKTLCKPGDTLADIGAGNGRLKDYLPQDITYLGIEPSSSLRANHPEIQAGQLPKLPLPNVTADIVTCLAVLHHLPALDHQAAIQELLRIAKIGGHIIASAWNLDGSEYEKIPGGDTGDVWVPWHAEQAEAKRFVHLFTEHEWKNLWTVPCIQIEHIGLDANQKNWLVVARKTC